MAKCPNCGGHVSEPKTGTMPVGSAEFLLGNHHTEELPFERFDCYNCGEVVEVEGRLRVIIITEDGYQVKD